MAEGGCYEDGGCGSGYCLAGLLDGCLWLQCWCIFNIFSGFGLIGCSDAWIFIDFDRFLMIFIDFRVSWRLGCLEVRILLISIDFH